MPCALKSVIKNAGFAKRKEIIPTFTASNYNLMKRLFLPLFLLCLAACNTQPKADFVTDPAKYVDPFIGTGGHGHTFPGATVPFGMVQFSPDTRMNDWDGC